MIPEDLQGVSACQPFLGTLLEEYMNVYRECLMSFEESRSWRIGVLIVY